MTNPFDNLITADLKQTYNNAISTLLAQSGLSLPCKLIYENNKKIECPNCEIDSMSGRSSNTFKTGGPIQFLDGQICPVCNGDGYRFESKEENIDLLVLFEYKYWINFNSNINSPDGMIQTICSTNSLTQIKAANRLLVDTNLTGVTRNYFSRASDPQPAGLGDTNYLFTFWKKI